LKERVGSFLRLRSWGFVYRRLKSPKYLVAPPSPPPRLASPRWRIPSTSATSMGVPSKSYRYSLRHHESINAMNFILVLTETATSLSNRESHLILGTLSSQKWSLGYPGRSEVLVPKRRTSTSNRGTIYLGNIRFRWLLFRDYLEVNWVFFIKCKNPQMFRSKCRISLTCCAICIQERLFSIQKAPARILKELGRLILEYRTTKPMLHYLLRLLKKLTTLLARDSNP
jgi:hypothetical protein